MAEKFVDTKEQLLAQSYDRHLSVNANAGSGKTTVLQKRFVALLLDNNLKVEPRELVAITFTRKAAAEIFAKIAKAIEEILQDSSLKKPQLAQLIRIRERLNSAHISTIHSFCSSIIRDFPVESGVLPNFSELSEAEKINIINEAITDTLTDYLTADDDNTEKLKTLISAFGKRKMELMIRNVLNKRDVFPKIEALYQKYSDEEISQIALNEFFNFLELNYFDSISTVNQIFEQLKNLELTIQQLSSITSFINILSTVIQLLKDKPSNPDLSFNLNIKTIFEELNKSKVLTKDYTLQSPTFKKIIGDDLVKYNSQLSNLKELIEVLSCLDDIKNQKEFISFSRFLFELSKQVEDTIEYKKQEAGGLDFDDILIKAEKMLANKDIAEKISNRFRFIMVDEFQDTNEIQYNIIKSLVPQLTDDSFNNSLNLFIVGDPKQSIYGFRNADVRVFKKATEDIKECNQKLIQDNLLSKEIKSTKELLKVKNDEESFGELGLTVSFRHLPVITAFTNIVCRKIMNHRESEFDVEYSDLICSKKIPELKDFILKYADDRQQTADRNLDEELFGSIKFIISEKTEKGREDEKVSESELLACHVQNLMINSQYKYSDIAVLSSTRARFKELSNAFQKYNIPYILHSGKGFYKAQEVIDMISILKFLHNPADDLALTSALRSPYFGISDAQTIFITASPQKNIFDKLEYLTENNANIDLVISRACEILKKLLSYSTKLGISHLISQTIEMCGWHGTSAASSGRAQVTANLMKLKQYASDFEKRGFKTLFDFVEEMNLITKADVSEGEAAYITDDNAINMMTIHAAKGLEFPVVALFNTNSGGNNKADFFIDEGLGLAFRSPYYNEDLQIFQQIETPLYSIAKNKNIFREKAELKRLLYVALTRAKEHLIITADLNKSINKSSLFHLIMEGMSVEMTFLENDARVYSDELTTYSEGNIDIQNIYFQVDIINDIDIIPTTASINSDVISFPEILMEDIKSEISNDMFSASRIIKFKNDKETYFSRYLLGFDDNFILRQAQDETDRLSLENSKLTLDEDIPQKSLDEINYDINISSAEEGTIIHYLMENIHSWYVSGNVDSQSLINLIDEASLIIHKKVNSKLRDKIIREISNVVKTVIIKSNIHDIFISKHEAEFNIPVLNDFLNAKIDLLFENDSVYEVWDWKSNEAKSRDDMIQLAMHYDFQMKVYAYLIMLLQPQYDTFKARLLFTKLARPGANDEDWTYVFQWTKAELQNFKSELEGYILQIKSV